MEKRPNIRNITPFQRYSRYYPLSVICMVSNNKINVKKEMESLQKKLLDMSLRNNFLNFRVLKRTVPIVDESITELFKILILNEQSMEFLPKDDEIEDLENDDETLILEDRDNIWKMVNIDSGDTDKYLDTYLQTDLTEKNLQKRLFTLYQNYKTSITEQGSNTLFLALGFLEWKDVEHQDASYKSPLILIPVEISRDSVGSPFKVKWDKSEIYPNLSLQNKLIEQNVDFPIFEELIEQEDLCAYFDMIRNAISSKSDWSIIPEIYLSTFSFKKLLIYKDLDSNNWSKESLKKIDSLLFNPEPAEIDTFEPYELDEIDSTNSYQVLDADSSQMEVIEVIKKSNNLVVEGPPGTGKSQTIVNLIAELMGRNKSVLFVSEKMAALEVVKSRLDTIGLGIGCLELHSNKSNKRAVLDELDKTLNDNSVYNYSLKDYAELNHLKNELNNYFSSLHEGYGKSTFYPYMLFGVKERELNYLESNNQEIIDFKIDNLLDFDETRQRKTLADLNNIQITYETVCPVSKNPWKNILTDNLAPNKLGYVKKNLDSISSDLNLFINKLDSLSSLIKCSKFNYLKEFDYFLSNLNVIRPGLFILENEIPISNIITNIEQYQLKLIDLNLDEKFSPMLFSKIKDVKDNLSQLISLSNEIVLNLNCSNLDNLQDFDLYIENLSILEPDLKIIKDNKGVLNLIRNIEEYNKNLNSINLIEKLPLNFNELSKTLNRLIDNLSSLESISNIISREVFCLPPYNLSQIDDWISNLKVLTPEMKIINNTDDLKHIIDNVKAFQSYLNSIETKNFSENVGIYKSNVNTFHINIKRIMEYLDEFYSMTGVKINNLKNIDRILDETRILENPNLCMLEDDLDLLINKIHQYKTTVKDLNVDIFELDLKKMFSETNNIYANINNLSISLKLLSSEDIDKLHNKYQQIKDNLMLSPFKDYIDDSNLYKQLKKTYYNSDNFSEEVINKIFEKIKEIYLYDVDNNEILMDIGLFIKNIDELNKLKNEILNPSYKNDLSFKEFDLIFEFENNANNIKHKLLKYDDFDINSIEDLQYCLARLVIFNGLYEYIVSNDNIGNKYFGKNWKSYRSNLNDLINQRNNLIKFNELVNSGLFSDKTLNNISLLDCSSFSTLSNNIRKLKKNIIEDINNSKFDLKTIFSLNIDELSSNIENIAEDLSVLEKWELFKESNANLKLLDYNLNSVKNSVNSLLDHFDDEIFIEICSEINDLKKCEELMQEIDSENEMAKTYLSKDWQGYNSDIQTLENHYSQLVKFNKIVDSGFFTQEVEQNLSNLNFIDFNHKLEEVNSIHKNILKDFNYLKEFSFKLDINSTSINDLKVKLTEVLTNFSDIDEWFIFKSNIGFGNLPHMYYYDFEKLNNSIMDFSHYFDINILNNISLEIADLIRLKDLKEQIDSDELGEKYFKKYWEGSSSNLKNIKLHYEKLTQFNALVQSKFFTSKTEEILCDFDITDLNKQISHLTDLKEKIFEDFTLLNSLKIFKNNKLINLPIISLYDKIEVINENLTEIECWEEYKTEKIKLNDKSSEILYDLFNYDFEKVKDSFTNLLNYCNFDDDLENEINTILKLKEIKEVVDTNDSNGKKYFRDLWNNVDSDTVELNAFFNDLKHFNKLLNSNFYSKDTISTLETLNYEEFNSYINELEDLNKSINNSFSELNDVLDFNEIIDNKNNFNISLTELNKKFEYLNGNYDELIKLNSFYSFSKRINNPYLENIVPLIWEDKINGDCIVSLFKFNVANNILNEITESNVYLRNFNENVYNKNIEKFKEIDKEILQLNQQRIRNILNENKPVITGKTIPPASELGILMKEINKKRRNIPIRQLLQKTGNIISKIKPCFMMSPLSVANYLDPKYFKDYFDYVIFDEASQIKTEDVIGIFFRGKNFAIMGDSKQLPPTTFFDSEEVNEDDDSLYVEIESILKLCRSIFPDKMLKWHYRSRHESLISVSNHEFYNNNLIVFPSPFSQKDELGLKLEYNPKNYYDRGKSSKNIGEAKDIIEYAINYFKKYGNTKSLGIGTFGIKQKDAILEELEYRLRKNPELEQYFNESGENGFFIKNLENIQGDERDVILISVGYGFDNDGKISNNFGPLNKNGGERRLNVLITRAREKCVVFCNFLPDDLHVTTSKSRGLKAFKNFLYYAKNKKYPVIMEPTYEDFDSPFEESVHDFLVENGYNVTKQVGCKGYKIDLAIVDPDNPDKYILGIECDGATYHSSASARERDRLRQEILEGLGWKFHRIWSTDWFNSRVTAKKRLINAVDEAIKNKDIPSFTKNPIKKPNPKPKPVPKVHREDLFIDYKFFKDSGNLNKYNRVELIENLIKYEQPIHIDDIYESMKIILNEKKKTKRLKNSTSTLISNNLNKNTIYMKGDFYYHKTFDINKFTPRKRIKPSLNKISNDEIKLAIINTLKSQYDTPKEELIKASSKNLGFNKVGNNIKKRFLELINELIKEKRINLNENGSLGLKNDHD